jgi:hypothetical protein
MRKNIIQTIHKLALEVEDTYKEEKVPSNKDAIKILSTGKQTLGEFVDNLSLHYPDNTVLKRFKGFDFSAYKWLFAPKNLYLFEKLSPVTPRESPFNNTTPIEQIPSLSFLDSSGATRWAALYLLEFIHENLSAFEYINRTYAPFNVIGGGATSVAWACKNNYVFKISADETVSREGVESFTNNRVEVHTFRPVSDGDPLLRWMVEKKLDTRIIEDYSDNGDDKNIIRYISSGGNSYFFSKALIKKMSEPIIRTTRLYAQSLVNPLSIDKRYKDLAYQMMIDIKKEDLYSDEFSDKLSSYSVQPIGATIRSFITGNIIANLAMGGTERILERSSAEEIQQLYKKNIEIESADTKPSDTSRYNMEYYLERKINLLLKVDFERFFKFIFSFSGLSEDWFEQYIMDIIRLAIHGHTDLHMRNVGVDSMGYLKYFDSSYGDSSYGKIEKPLWLQNRKSSRVLSVASLHKQANQKKV